MRHGEQGLSLSVCGKKATVAEGDEDLIEKLAMVTFSSFHQEMDPVPSTREYGLPDHMLQPVE